MKLMLSTPLKLPVHYKVELYDPRSGGFMPSSPGIGMHVEVKDPDDKIIMSRVYSSEGKHQNILK